MARRPASIGPAEIARHPSRIDVRSPSEFAIDHLPGAANAPVLDDAERARIGTIHAEVSGFAARREGAALVSRNIARIIDTLARDKPIEWSPLVYCWRGGQRSRSLAHVLGEIGFDAVQLAGGYRAFRRHVVEQLAALPAQRRFVVVCGFTGAGKTRLIEALARRGAQVLDLERLARHRGSLLGDDPSAPQPSQKHFETGIHSALEAADAARPVFVESESRRIGKLQLPDAVLEAIRGAPALHLDTPAPLRASLLMRDYAHFRADPGTLVERLRPLAPLVGNEAVARWDALAGEGDFDTLVADLLERHYDPLYRRSIERHFPRDARQPRLAPASVDDGAFDRLAEEAMAAARDLVPAA